MSPRHGRSIRCLMKYSRNTPDKRWTTRRYGMSRSRQSRTSLSETAYLSQDHLR